MKHRGEGMRVLIFILIGLLALVHLINAYTEIPQRGQVRSGLESPFLR